MLSQKRKPCLVGVAGGSGSGKTYFARNLQTILGSTQCEIISQDNFYIDQSQRFDGDGGSVNFDHPNSIDFPLLAEVLKNLQSAQSAKIPIYDFVTHKRQKDVLEIQAKPIIVVDGTLVFHSELVRSFFDATVFFDTPEELRFQRRLQRDVKERGRSDEGVRKQFVGQVKPMHDLFVEPSKAFAQVLVRDLAEYSQALSRLAKALSDVVDA